MNEILSSQSTLTPNQLSEYLYLALSLRGHTSGHWFSGPRKWKDAISTLLFPIGKPKEPFPNFPSIFYWTRINGKERLISRLIWNGYWKDGYYPETFRPEFPGDINPKAIDDIVNDVYQWYKVRYEENPPESFGLK